MENGEIEDSQITSSTNGREASNGRLNAFNTYWSTNSADRNQWIQVCFHESVAFTAIATQGDGVIPSSWVSSYAVSYSFDGETFHNYTVNGTRKVR
jgi:hypothetical protein